MPIESRDPATGEVMATFEEHSDAEVSAALDGAREAFPDWRATNFQERRDLLLAVAKLLERDRDRLAVLATREMGKLIGESRSEVEKCINGVRYFAEHAEAYLRDEIIKTERRESYVTFQPLGVLLSIMPWNFPYWQVFRFAAPGIAAGNVTILKHASNVPQCALAIAELFRGAGFPPNVFQTLLIGGERAQRLVEDDRIAAVSLTGSERAGSLVASAAASAIKTSVLELGGSDPFIVMPSADFAAAVETGVKARIVNNGQSCIAAKRFIIHADIYDAYVNAYSDRMRALRVGPPLDETSEMGPLALPAIRDELEDQVKRSIDAGATIVSQGTLEHRSGNYFAPVVLADIPDDAPAAREELFGPVASMFRVETLDEAITVANRTTFGLGASVWTTNGDEQKKFIAGVESGMVFVNALVASDPRLPFGGVKRSGFGRELSRYGIREFVNVKTAVVA